VLATASDVYGPAVHLSRDLTSWQQVDVPPRFDDGSPRKVNQIWTFARAGQRLFAGVDEAALFSSDDGGLSWQHVESLSSHRSRDHWFPGFGGLCAHAILVDPRNANRLWCAISAVGVFRSDDGGLSWHGKNEGVPVSLEDQMHKDIGFCVHALAQDPSDADVIYRQDHKGMFRTRDGGEHWERNEQGLPSSFGFPIVVDRSSSTLYSFPLESDEYRIPVGGRFRVHRSRDGGSSWHEVGRGLPDQA
jgi:photosystem II stability/assembly factor-like uncharacterized protein